YSLASRLSYFLWATMPDDELLRLVGAGQLRKQLPAQVRRMLKDARFHAFIEDFTGQWLRTRDIEIIPLEPRVVLALEEQPGSEAAKMRKRFNHLEEKSDAQLTADEREELARIRENFHMLSSTPLELSMNGELRHAMRLETEKVFDRVLREDRSLL